MRLVVDFLGSFDIDVQLLTTRLMLSEEEAAGRDGLKSHGLWPSACSAAELSGAVA
jgi:hypothetical protein